MKNNILHTMSDQEVIAAIEQNMIGYISACVRTGREDVYEEPELTWVFTGTPLPFFNGVIRTSLASPDSDVTIEKALNFYQLHQQIMTWWVSPLSCPSRNSQPRLSVCLSTTRCHEDIEASFLSPSVRVSSERA